MPHKKIFELENVSKEYFLGEVIVKALKDLDLNIYKKDYVTIMGPSGSGKSTLLNLIGLLTEPTKGTIKLDGKDVSHLNEDQRAYVRGKELGFVFQTFNLIPTFTAVENVSIPMTFYGVSKKERIERAEDLLAKVGLSERMHHLPSQMSGGERQRVAIARALANEPEIILADEPTGNLDSKSGSQILEIFDKLNKQGKTIIIVTHDKNISKRTKKNIFLKDGELDKTKKVIK